MRLEYERPLPGTPTVTFFPFGPKFVVMPGLPTDRLAPLLLRFMRSPLASRIERRNRKPILLSPPGRFCALPSLAGGHFGEPLPRGIECFQLGGFGLYLLPSRSRKLFAITSEALDDPGHVTLGKQIFGADFTVSRAVRIKRDGLKVLHQAGFSNLSFEPFAHFSERQKFCARGVIHDLSPLPIEHRPRHHSRIQIRPLPPRAPYGWQRRWPLLGRHHALGVPPYPARRQPRPQRRERRGQGRHGPFYTEQLSIQNPVTIFVASTRGALLS